MAHYSRPSFASSVADVDDVVVAVMLKMCGDTGPRRPSLVTAR